MPIAVCSRTTDYEALKTKLNLTGAVLLQPLTPEQIDEYFEQAGSELVSVNQMLQHDFILRRLVKQPLMLSIVTLAYRGVSVSVVASARIETINARRKQLFETYIQQMFERAARTKSNLYSPEKTKDYLAWLAYKLQEQGQSIFLLDRMQQNWLHTSSQRKLNNSLNSMIGILIGVFCGGVTGGIVLVLSGKRLGIFFDELYLALVGGIVGSVIGGLVGRSVFISQNPQLAEVLSWSWKKAFAHAIRNGLLSGLVGALLLDPKSSLISRLFGKLVDEPKMVFVIGVLFALLGILAGVLFDGWEIAEMQYRAKPDQGMKQSFKNSLFVFLITGLFIGFIMSVIGFMRFGMLLGIVMGVASALIFGAINGLANGGDVVVYEYILRIILFFNGNIPWHPVRFLDYCVDRIFLRRVGGGYIFVHRLLMEHFASMYDENKT